MPLTTEKSRGGGGSNVYKRDMKANELDLEHAELEVPGGLVEISSKLLAHGFTDQEN